jgi:hypothetical protein
MNEASFEPRRRGGARFALVVTMLASIAWLVPGAHADCGDDIDGARVPCACGDVVVVDTRLDPSDPIVQGPCIADGLVVRARPDASHITVDLNGLTIRGQGVGVGVRVLDGGADGARILGGEAGGEATIAGFREAVRATRPGALAALAGVRAGPVAQRGIVVRAERHRALSLEVDTDELTVVGAKRARRNRSRGR